MQSLQGNVTLLLRRQGCPKDVVFLLQPAVERPPEIGQHVGKGVPLREGAKENRPIHPAGETVPAGELSRRAGLAATGVGVEQNEWMAVEGAIQREDRFVAANEADGRFGRQLLVNIAALRRGLVHRDMRQRQAVGLALALEGGDGVGLVDHRHDPILQRHLLEGNLTVGIGVQLLAPTLHRLAQRLPTEQGAVEFVDELGGGDDVDAVAHRYHPSDLGVDHLLGE